MGKSVIKRCIVGLLALALVITSIPFGMNRVKASNDTIETGSNIYIYYKENSSTPSGYSLRLVSEKTKASMSGWTAGNNQGIASWSGSEKAQDGYVPVYEVYNPINDDYHYSLDEGEVDFLVSTGWVRTGVLTYVPESGEPVYRMYNPNNGMHYYTPYPLTVYELTSYGWNDEGVVWYTSSMQSQDPDSIPDDLKGKTSEDKYEKMNIHARYTDKYGAVREREYTTTEQDLNKIFGDLVNEKFSDKKDGIDWTISYSSYSYETASKMTVKSVISNLKGGKTIYLSAVDEGQNESIEPGKNVYVYFRQDSASLSGYAYRLVTEKTKSSMSGWTAGNNQGIASWTGSEESQDGFVPLYEIFNPNSMEYIYTLDANEVAYLASMGWIRTGVLTYVPETGYAVYRTYNAENGTHYYTPYAATVTDLISYGWNDEGVVWYTSSMQSQDPDSLPDKFKGKTKDDYKSIIINAKYTDKYGVARENVYTTNEQDWNKNFEELLKEKFPDKKDGIEWILNGDSYSYEIASKMSLSSVISFSHGATELYLNALEEGACPVTINAKYVDKSGNIKTSSYTTKNEDLEKILDTVIDEQFSDKKDHTYWKCEGGSSGISYEMINDKTIKYLYNFGVRNINLVSTDIQPEPTPEPEPTPTPLDNVDSVDEQSGTAVVNNEFTGEKDTVDISIIEQSDIYRMYNPATAEHLYTKDAGEVEWLKSLGWNHETESDYTVVDARDDDATPVYRLFNPSNDTHHYTESVEEVRYDVSIGWVYERISHYVYDKNSTKGTPQWRLYEVSGAHNWTSDQGEIRWLESMGWINEGIRWRVL